MWEYMYYNFYNNNLFITCYFSKDKKHIACYKLWLKIMYRNIVTKTLLQHIVAKQYSYRTLT